MQGARLGVHSNPWIAGWEGPVGARRNHPARAAKTVFNVQHRSPFPSLRLPLRQRELSHSKCNACHRVLGSGLVSRQNISLFGVAAGNCGLVHRVPLVAPPTLQLHLNHPDPNCPSQPPNGALALIPFQRTSNAYLARTNTPSQGHREASLFLQFPFLTHSHSFQALPSLPKSHP
ncbi:hypothetical protein K469DRAFT_120837 [Zopfia rhizophila CBS 207.26]|uniref:Uncharacterized protein n=1 Tax=Zopfia rhizophila CBS 207.26 TaxID=1314779 RepID=A0A6A6E4W7_9PEZI|nr:hypothetical protein K469DRAFT_120837 [Zopfia rhizophila CBS 207.26]